MIKGEKRTIVQRVYNAVMEELKREPGFREWLYGPDFDGQSRAIFLARIKSTISKELPRATKE
jgi:hypothetical protein